MGNLTGILTSTKTGLSYYPFLEPGSLCWGAESLTKSLWSDN